MKLSRKLLSLLLAVIMVAVCFAGCNNEPSQQSSGSSSAGGSSSQEEQSEPDQLETEWSYELDTTPVDITDFFRARWWDGVIDEGSGWEDSAVFNQIREKTGVSFYYEVPAASEAEVMGTMIASGTYPDMITFSSYTSPYIQQMKDAGLIYSITELANEYAPKLYSENLIAPSMHALHSDENDQLWNYIGFEVNDDSIAAYKEIEFTPTSGHNIMYVRKDLLSAYGKDDIITWEDYNAFLAFIRDNDPDAHPFQPESNSWIFGAIPRHFLAKFGAHLSRTYPNVGEKKIEFILKDPACKDYLKWLNDLYQDGILNDTLVAMSSQSNNENLYAGKYGAIISSTFTAANSVNTTITTNDGNDDRVYVPITNVLVDENIGFQVVTDKAKGQSATVITKNCENPDRAIRLLEYFLTEDGQVNGVLGVEGETWEWKDGSRVLMDEPFELITSNLLGYAQKYKVLGSFSQFALNRYWAYYCDDFLTPKGELRDLHNTQLGPYLTEIWNYGFVGITESFEAGSDEDVIKTRVLEATNNGVAKIIASKSDDEFEARYSALLDELEGLGLATVEQVYTDAYLGYCDDFGITPFEQLYERVPME